MGWIERTLAGGCLAAAVGLQALPAQAANTPQIGPIPAWVHAPPPLSAEKPAVQNLPIMILLTDIQVSFDADGWTEFHEIKAKAQTRDGLQLLGSIPFQWSPWSDTLTFHHARILRDGQTIDVLPKDGVFTVLRRETGLEQAMLTGELTAVLQPEGLQVGDVLEIGVSIRHADPLLKGRPSAAFAGWDASPVGHMRMEAHWPSALPVRWRETAGLPPFRRTDANGVTTVALDLDDVRPPVPPAHAPQRFQHGRQIEFTTFGDWQDVASVMAPLYAKAAELGPQSPVLEQAKLIAAASSDPKVRAGAALRLVQDQVRYLAHAEAGGGYTPQSADETWRLRYGDCKAKTALLLALLHQLGVPAEPVLANIAGGDGLDAHLPSQILFNHIFVRVKLDGRDYWLDGAREGDRSLEELSIPAYGWVLPLDPAGSRLVRIDPAPATLPQIRQVIRYDASGGVTAPEPTHLETVFRGDAGLVLHAQLAAVPPERLDAALQAYWAGVHTAFTPTHVAATWDAAKGEERLTADGASKLDWSGSGLELQHVALGGAPDLKRDPAATDPDAPYVVDFPSYVETDESVVLPPGDGPSAAEMKAAEFDAVIGGVAYKRTASVSNGVVRVVASERGLKPEITAAEARASVDQLTKLGADSFYVTAGNQAQAANDAAALDSHPTTADGHVDRGTALLDAWRLVEALAEFDAAIAIDPKDQLAWANRAIAHAQLGDPAAIADADKADALGKPEIIAARARGIFAAKIGDAAGARTAYRHALTLEPEDKFTLTKLIDLDAKAGDTDAAETDLDTLMRAHPEMSARSHLWRAAIQADAHHQQAAEQELAKAPFDTTDALIERTRIYLQLGDKDLARADIETANRLKPNAKAWLMLAGLDGGYLNAKANADIEAALKLAPDDMELQIWKVNAASMRHDYAAALSLMDTLLRSHAENAGNLLVGRAQIEAKLGRTAAMDADFAQAQALAGASAPDASTLCEAEVSARRQPDRALADCERGLRMEPTSPGLLMNRAVLLHRLGRQAEADKAIADASPNFVGALTLNNLCYLLATENMQLARALDECDASLKLDPHNAATLDSRAFVLMRLDRNAEALEAYNAALAANPQIYNSLYGRGLVEARLGRPADSARDIAAALAGNPQIRQTFADMGLTLPPAQAAAR